jgi:hypothetical protein
MTRAHGVRVFGFRPGFVRTALLEEGARSAAGKQWLPGRQAVLDSGRLTPPEEAARWVMFLASGKADELSGRVLSATYDMTALVPRSDEIRREGRYVLRLSHSDRRAMVSTRRSEGCEYGGCVYRVEQAVSADAGPRSRRSLGPPQVNGAGARRGAGVSRQRLGEPGLTAAPRDRDEEFQGQTLNGRETSSNRITSACSRRPEAAADAARYVDEGSADGL